MTHKISGNKSRNLSSKFHPIQKKYNQQQKTDVTNMGHVRLKNVCQVHLHYALKSHKRQKSKILVVPKEEIKFSEALKPFVLLW